MIFWLYFSAFFLLSVRGKYYNKTLCTEYLKVFHKFLQGIKATRIYVMTSMILIFFFY